MVSLKLWLLFALIMFCLLIFIFVFPPQKLSDLNERLNTQFGSNNMTDKILEKSLQPCKVKVLQPLREEKHHIYDIQPSNDKRVILITVSEKAVVELNTSSGRRAITDVIRTIGKKKVYYHGVDEGSAQRIRVVNNEGMIPLVQVAVNPSKQQ